MHEKRSVNLEIKRVSEREFEGYGSVFNNVDLGGDIVAPGAFRGSLERHEHDGTFPVMCWMHHIDDIPGAWLEMKEDSKGLYVKGKLADTTLGRDVRELLRMKAVRGLSIGFRTIDADYMDSGVRRLKEVDLIETSIVSMAMNPLAQVERAKSRLTTHGQYVPTEREFEQMLRSHGISRNVAKHMVSKIYDGSNGTFGTSYSEDQREAEKSTESLRDADAMELIRKLESQSAAFIRAALE